MASDTATLDLEAIRAEARRQEDASSRVELGPEDRAPEDTGPIETDPATRAHLIVQEVLAAAAKQDTSVTVAPQIPVTPDSTAAAQARRIVEEVLAAAEHARPAGRTDVEDDTATEPVHRADLVMLGIEQPLVLVPGETFPATPAAFTPPARQPLETMVSQALAPLAEEPIVEEQGYDVEIDETRASQDLREAIEKAAASESMHPTRWIIAGVVWAVSFAIAVPVLLNGIVSSFDMTVDLWGDETVATQPADVTEGADVAAE